MVRAWRLLCVFTGLPQIKLTKILAAGLLLRDRDCLTFLHKVEATVTS